MAGDAGPRRVRRPSGRAPLVGFVRTVRDFFTRNLVPYRWLLADEPEGGRLLGAAGLAATQVPLVVTADGTVLVRPTEAELAAP